MSNLRPVFRRAQLLSAVIAIATALILPTAVPTDAQGNRYCRLDPPARS